MWDSRPSRTPSLPTDSLLNKTIPKFRLPLPLSRENRKFPTPTTTFRSPPVASTLVEPLVERDPATTFTSPRSQRPPPRGATTAAATSNHKYPGSPPEHSSTWRTYTGYSWRINRNWSRCPNRGSSREATAPTGAVESDNHNTCHSCTRLSISPSMQET